MPVCLTEFSAFVRLSSAASGLNLRSIVKRRIPLPTSLRRQVHHVPNRIQFIDATLFDVVGQPRMTTVKMAQRAVTVSCENRNRGVLMSFAIFAAKIIFKSAVTGAQQT